MKRSELLAALASARAQLEAANAAIRVLDSMVANDTDDDQLVDADDRAFGLLPDTFRRWAREGRLQCFTAERGRLVAWRSEVKRAIEAQRYQPKERGREEAEGDLTDFSRELASGKFSGGSK